MQGPNRQRSASCLYSGTKSKFRAIPQERSTGGTEIWLSKGKRLCSANRQVLAIAIFIHPHMVNSFIFGDSILYLSWLFP